MRDTGTSKLGDIVLREYDDEVQKYGAKPRKTVKWARFGEHQAKEVEDIFEPNQVEGDSYIIP